MTEIIRAETGLDAPDYDLDVVTFEVLRSLFDYAAERMSSILMRSSFSQILADNVDFSNAIYDPQMRLIAQAANCPVHLAAMHFSTQAVAERFGIENLKEGDVVVLNDPYQGGTHINDLTFTMPIFYEGTLIGFAVSRGHWMDLGGGAAGGLAGGTHIAGEGLRIPPMKIFSAGEINEDLVGILTGNSRTPEFIRGDLQAHLGALRGAEVELQNAAARYGTETLDAAMKELLGYTERITRKAAAEIPDGTYYGEDYADTDGQSDDRVHVKVKLTISGSDIEVDFTGSDAQVVGAINSPVANTVAAVYYSLQFFLAPDAPPNAGMFAPITVKLPQDCWLNAKWPAPVSNCTCITASKITAALWLALGQAIPDKIIAPTFSEANWFMGTVTTREKGMSVFTDILSGGWGGTPYNDGMSVTMDPLGNCLNTPAEAAELMHDIVYEGFELNPNSGGPGRYRGGLGCIFSLRFLGDGHIGIETSRTIEGSPGVNGGQPSIPQRLIRTRAQDDAVIGGLKGDNSWVNPLANTFAFKPQDIFRFEATGGGGWGNPFDRPVAEVVDDVIDEYITPEHAEKYYGVVVDPATYEVNAERTRQLRSMA
ncbi:MAG: hydantoinase B/oxoprolinase family protein [Pseudomonadota bacterium]